MVPEVDELTSGEPEEAVVDNARRKARAGLEMAGGEGDLIVLGVDTEVVLDGRLLGKAGNEEEARERLEALSGRTHEVLSGVVVIARAGTASLDFVSHTETKSSIGADASPSVPGGGVAERSGRRELPSDVPRPAPGPPSAPTSPRANGATGPARMPCRGSARRWSSVLKETFQMSSGSRSGCSETSFPTCSTQQEIPASKPLLA